MKSFAEQRLTCGCGRGCGCVCVHHQDVPNGRPAHTCDLHRKSAAEWLAGLDMSGVREHLAQAAIEDAQDAATVGAGEPCHRCGGSGWLYTVSSDGEGYVKDGCLCTDEAQQ